MTDHKVRELYRSAQSGDADAVEALLAMHRGLVIACVRRFYRRGEKDDLMQEGMLGLLTAIRRFDPDREIAFSTFAVPHVMGKLRRWIQKSGTLSMSRCDRIAFGKMQRLREERLSEGKSVRLSELAKEVNMRPEEAAALLLGERFARGGTEEEIGVSGGESGVLLRVDLERAAGALGVREKEIIFRRYFQNESQVAVAQRLGLSQAQVSRLEKTILRRLRQYME